MTCPHCCHCRYCNPPPSSEVGELIASAIGWVTLPSIAFILTGIPSAMFWSFLLNNIDLFTQDSTWGQISYILTMLVSTALTLGSLAMTIYGIYFAARIAPQNMPAARRQDQENLRRWRNGQKPIYLGKT